VQVPHLAWFMIALLFLVITFSVLSKLIAYLFTLSRKTTLYMNCIEIPIIFICGFVVPLEALPVWMQAVGKVLPPTWAVELLRISLEKDAEWGLFVHKLLILVMLNGIYATLSIGLVKIIERHVRIRASLEVS